MPRYRSAANPCARVLGARADRSHPRVRARRGDRGAAGARGGRTHSDAHRRKKATACTPGQTVLTLDTRDVVAGDRSRQGGAGAAEAQLRVVQAAARPEDVRQAESQIATARADQSAAESELGGRGTGPRALRKRCSSPTPGRRSSATMRRRAATWPATGWRPRRAESARRKKRWRAFAPAPAAKKWTPPAPASTVVTAQIASLEKTLGDATLHLARQRHRHREARRSG